ncbi:3-phosphoserine/phosphohydroxythreonine transaminase [Bowmanella sp. JS7-9]|uniref:Phosphoserine aminotransferase n=1 Tax=Pseudobowmanella zhangzhouensis TaxID=1537679 RepID=A0ABW1XJN4_9ALTE|nr:3-phosphoserine/phosphohydroxythreonine transaminase [Bowmanella sp. JS7-9]TBX27494.1 3-phosphoserine/phosphohydroxythreonine aminotransferase [Bowmanella sp. JS7-9]
MTNVYNFCAGPAMLPVEVMKQAQQEFLNWQGCGSSVMEISHRSKPFVQLAEQAEQDLRDLLAIPDDYHVLFMHGGGRGQFAAVPLNLATQGQAADYLTTGSWSSAALTEANKYVVANEVAKARQIDGLWAVPEQSAWQVNNNAAYFHYCPNETVDGIELPDLPDVSAPIVADMSSCILSKPIDVSRYGLIYAGAQKNIGPSGLSVVIVKKDLLKGPQASTPAIFDYALQGKEGSMYNTPPTYAWYLAGLVFQWLKKQGGVNAMEAHNRAKAELLYQCIDDSDFYRNQVAKPYRSRMNVPFQLANPSLDAQFLKQAEQQGLTSLQGHRSVGGMRASIYNAMPLAGVQALTEFMREFERSMG